MTHQRTVISRYLTPTKAVPSWNHQNTLNSDWKTIKAKRQLLPNPQEKLRILGHKCYLTNLTKSTNHQKEKNVDLKVKQAHTLHPVTQKSKVQL